MTTITETRFADRMQNIPESFIREILKVSTTPDMISFAGGLPNPAFFPIEKMAMAAEKVLNKDGRVVLQYAPTEGYLPLRDYIAHRQSVKSGRALAAEDILILNGSQQGLDLIGKLFLNQGSGLLLEAPSYLGAIQAFSAYQPTFHEVVMENGGPNINALQSGLAKLHASLFYCVPTFQNPTGNTYDLFHRKRVAELIAESGTMLVEDNPYVDIYFKKNDLPDLLSLIPGQTIQLGSFSKIVSPGLRLGWAIGPQAVIRKMAIAKQASDLHSSNFGQRILYQFLLDNSLEDHLISIREFYKKQAYTMNQLMKQYFPQGVTWTQPAGGMFIWITLPEAMDATVLLNNAISQSVVFVPGQHFYVKKNAGKNTIRVNFSNPSEDQMAKGIRIMGDLIRSYVYG
jgi:2-aminoadipate transaminase